MSTNIDDAEYKNALIIRQEFNESAAEFVQSVLIRGGCRRGFAMRAHRPGNEPQSANQQYQHHQRLEQSRGLKIDMHIGDHAGQDKERTRGGEQPSNGAAAVKEQNGNAEQQRDQRNAKTIGAPETPVRTHDGNLVGDEIAADAGHNKAHHKFAQAAGRAANIGH